jgi:hypothetical protein
MMRKECRARPLAPDRSAGYPRARAPHGHHPAPKTRLGISRKMRRIRRRLVRAWRPAGRGCRLGALPRFLTDHFPWPSFASLPKIEADDGLIRAGEGWKALSRVREGALC